MSIEPAHAELQQLLPTMREEMKKTAEWGREARVTGMQDHVTGDIRSSLLILLAAVGLILLLAAVNLGTLVLSRSIERAREMAVRTALGATRWRLLQGLVAEHTLLASAGALVGSSPPGSPSRCSSAASRRTCPALAISGSTCRCSVPSLPPQSWFGRHGAGAGGRRHAARCPATLRQGQSTETPARRRTLGSLVIAQVALAIVLGIGAGLMLRTLWNLQQVDPGFNAANVLTFRLQTTSRRMDLTTGLAYFEGVLGRVRAIPGVREVGAIQHLPMSGYNWTANVWRPETPPAPGAPARRRSGALSAGILRRDGDWARAGRTFTPQDRQGAPAVAIINEALARREFGSPEAAIGRRLTSFSAGGETPSRSSASSGTCASSRSTVPPIPRCIAPSRRRSCFRWRSW